ncbi:hypothetical protein [Falsiphaeobacter marinintestinus]|uniref:hypothetical protein n=1 Tax=Falsiphaeobacter marinintestinus TaxID=1492905 RepID=UPI0011B6CCCA|nr:hypothetical protein [Phaeobacter marinintestinus]
MRLLSLSLFLIICAMAPIKAHANNQLHVKPVRIIDQNSPAGAIEAYRTLAPVDWSIEGGILWNPPSGCHRGGQLVWEAMSPDKSYSLSFLPPISWSASNRGAPGVGCLNMDLTDSEQMMRGYLQAAGLAGAQIIKVERPAELTQIMQAWTAPFLTGHVYGQQRWADATVVQTRARLDGREYDTAIITISLHYQITTPDPLWPSNPIISRGGNSAYLLALSTPVGQLDAGHPAFSVILQNLRANPAWNKVVAQWWARQNRRPSGGGSSGGESVTDLMFESWKRREGIKDQGHASSVNSIWEVQPYHLPDGGEVTLSQDYGNAWLLEDDTIILTDDNLFNPLQQEGQFGQQLVPVR